MIHSLSGGVIKDGGVHTFVKVRMPAGDEKWFLCDDFPVQIGAKVIVPFGSGGVEAEVVRVDKGLSVQATPVPFSRAQSVINIVFEEEE